MSKPAGYNYVIGGLIFLLLVSLAFAINFPIRMIADQGGQIASVDADNQLEVDGDMMTTPAANLGIYRVACDSQTATALRAANTTRVAINFLNWNATAMYISTSAADAGDTDQFRIIPAYTEWSDSDNPYNGAWYGLTFANTADTTMEVVDKSQ